MFEFNDADFKHSNREITDFIKQYKNTIYRACGFSPLREADWDVVVNAVALKFARGKLVHDPAKASMKTFVFTVAKRQALNEWRKSKPHRLLIVAPETMSSTPGDTSLILDGENTVELSVLLHSGLDGDLSREDCWLRINEALYRLSTECRNPNRIPILIRHAFFRERRDAVAKRFNVSANTVSLIKNRLMPRLNNHLKTIAEEEAKGLFSKKGNKIFIRREDLPL